MIPRHFGAVSEFMECLLSDELMRLSNTMCEPFYGLI